MEHIINTSNIAVLLGSICNFQFLFESVGIFALYLELFRRRMVEYAMAKCSAIAGEPTPLHHARIRISYSSKAS